MHGPRQRLRERSFADAGDVFNEQVAAREQTDHRKPDHFGLATDRRIQRHLQLIEFGKRHRGRNHYCHCSLSSGKSSLSSKKSSLSSKNNSLSSGKNSLPFGENLYGSA